MNEWIKKYPLCFQAFLADESYHKEMIAYDNEAFYRESVIGDYLRWFLEKSGKDKEIEKLKEENKKLIEILNDIKREALLKNYSLEEISVLATRESLERYFLDTQKQVREVLKELGDE